LKNGIKESTTGEQKKSPKSPLFNSTDAVELKAKHPTGDNPYEERWAFLGKALRKSFNKDVGNNG